MQIPAFLSALILLTAIQSNAQDYSKLTELKYHQGKVYCSAGFDTRAESIARRTDAALQYLGDQLDFRPSVIVLVLSQKDWSNYTNFPVYGMPHYNDDKTLIVAAEDNPFWKSFLPPPGQLPPGLREEVQKVYGQADGSLSLQPFFDLLVIHELGHAFHFQGGLNMQRRWLGELYANILLHSYVAEREPSALPALTLFPKMVIGAGTKEYTYTSLQDLEARYEEIGQRHAKNYGWYQSRWHAAAGQIYDAEGSKACRQLWDALRTNRTPLSDDALAKYLQENGGSGVASMMINWDRDTVR